MTQTGNIPQQNTETGIDERPRDGVKPAVRQRFSGVLASNWLLCLLVFGGALVFDLHNL